MYYSRSRRRAARAAVLVLASLLAALAVALAAVSVASYETVKERLDELASDGDAELTRTEFDAIVIRLRIAAGAAALAAAGVYRRRRRLARALAQFVSASMSAARELGTTTRTAIARESAPHLGALATVAIVGVALRLEFLFQPMRYDEAVTYVHYASQPLYIPLTTYTAPNNHVLHSLLAHISTGIFGGAPWAVRVPAFAAGVLLVPATYIAARQLYDRHAALVAAALVAASSVLVEYSTNARGYTIVALLFVLMLALAKRLTDSTDAVEWLAFAILAALGFFTVPVMLYGFSGVVAWLALTLRASGRRDLLVRRLVPTVVGTVALTALLYAPIAAASGVDAVVANEFVRSLGWESFAAELPESIRSVLRGWHRDMPAVVAGVLGAGFASALAFHRRVSRVALPPAVPIVAAIALILVLQRVVPFERVWLFLLPLYLMGAAAGVVFALRAVVAGGRRLSVIVAAVAVVGCVGLAGNALSTRAVARSEDTSTFRDGERVSAFLAERLRPGDRVLVAPPADAILEYYLTRHGLDPAALLYWRKPVGTKRLLAVVKEAPRNYPLEYLLRDPRLDGTRVGNPRLLRRFDDAAVYALPRLRSRRS